MTAPDFNIPGYELIRELGAGGMATVFLAKQISLDRKVAIKVMRRGLADENVEKRFLIEGRTMARLPHPNIVGVYDIVQNEQINYIAMEFLEGGMLSDKMREGLTLAEAVSVVVQIAGALQYAHDNDVVHRDLKPSNIMYRDAATPVLTDFGIAKAKNQETTRLTQTGMMIGTPTYMSPEQATGAELDGRSDQYALGVLFYEMLTGRAPFEGSTPIQVVLAHLNTPPPPLPPQFAFFQPLMDRMLAKDREQRFPDLRVFVKELKALLTGNEQLLQRLRVDPSQSASEQLRALGFSESQIHTGAGPSPAARVSGKLKRPAGPVTGSGPGVRLDPLPSGRPRWLLPAAAALVLVVGGAGVWFAFRPKPLSTLEAMDPARRVLVTTMLNNVDRMIEDGKLMPPPAGENAFDQLQAVQQFAGGLPETQQRFQKIADAFRRRAEDKLKQKAFSEAEQNIQLALAVVPDDAAAKQVQKAIAAAKVAGERESEVKALLAQADAAKQAKKLVGEGEDNALALLRRALEIDPNSAPAKQALDGLLEQLLQPAQQFIAQRQYDEAQRALDASAAYLASDARWQQLEQEIEKGRDLALQQQRIERLLDLARKQMAQGRIAEPPGDNALASLARLAEIDASNAGAAQLKREAGAALAKLAQQAERDKKFTDALRYYEQALRAVPDNTAYAQAREKLEQSLGQQQAQLARALSNASDAISRLNYFSPAGQSAREWLDKALALDPNNATARSQLAELPRLARESAAALAKEQRLDAALKLLQEAQAQYPDDAQIAALASQLKSDQQRALAAQMRSRRLAELQTLLADPRVSVDSARKTAAAINELLKADSKDADALRYRERFIGGLDRLIASRERPADLVALQPVLDQVKQQLGERSPDVAALLAAFKTRSNAVAAAERERLAALSGVLLLNATPWARIESVVDTTTGEAVSLEKDASTPLRLSLPAGTYRISFRHPNAQSSVAQVVSVKAQATQPVNAAFPTLTSADYLKRAGYAN